MNARSRDFAARLRIGRLVAVMAAVLLCAVTARANPVSLGSVDFTNNQGTLTGFFQLDTSTGTVTSWDLTTSAFNCADPVTCESSGFPALEYTSANSTANIGFSFGAQAITFSAPNVEGSDSVLGFVLNCGGANIDCIGTAAMGSTIPLVSASESRSIVPIARILSLASLTVTDPPGGVLSFNVVSGDGSGSGGGTNNVPEPSTALLLMPALGGLMLLRRQREAGI